MGVEREYLRLPLTKIRPYKGNPRKITADAVEAVVASIRECDNLDPIEVDENNIILSGHTRLKALKKLGYTDSDVIRYTGLSDEQKRKYRVLANKTGEISQWDTAKLEKELDGLTFDFDFGFDVDEPEKESEAEEEEIDDFDRLPKQLTHNVFENFDRDFEPIYVGNYDIPVIQPTKTSGTEFLRFCDWRGTDDYANLIAHFYYSDFKFISAWREPDKYVERLRAFKAVIAPDFSLYTDFPRALQILSCYRRQWVAAYWQSLGLDVIPDVVWGDESSYEFCFDGIPKGGTVAVSSVGVARDGDWNGKDGDVFRNGYNEMLKRLEPETVLYYGTLIEGLEGNIVRIPSFYEQRRALIGGKG